MTNRRRPALLFLLPMLLAAFLAPGRAAGNAAGSSTSSARPAARAAALPADLGAFVTGIQKRYDRINDFQGRFVQESRVQAAAVTEKSGGDVFFLKPGRMRWNYRTPDPQEIVIDRGKLWQYVPAHKQVVIQAFDAARVEYTFLTGLGSLERDFRISWAKPDRRPGDALRYLALAPRDEQATFVKVTLGVEPRTHRVLVTEVEDLFGNTTSIRFEGLRDNAGMDAGLFALRPPKGVDVIDMTSPAGHGR